MLATSLAWEGVFALTFRSALQWAWSILLIIGRALPAFIGGAFAVLVGLSSFISSFQAKGYFKFDLPDITLSNIPWQTVGWIGFLLLAVSVLLSFWLSRGLLQQVRYRSVLTAVANSRPLYLRNWAETAEKNGSGVMHVLVATDLLSGEPIYFSNTFIHCRPYGWSTPEYIRTEEALYSSAAFPAVFPPKKLKISKLNFQVLSLLY
jgi:predicted acylesterase/phospholipase RssA